jgi:hypothetical protein
MKYIDVVKNIVEECCFTTYTKNFINEGESWDGGVLSGDPSQVCHTGDFFSANLLNSNFYKIQGVRTHRNYFHDLEIIKFLRHYKKEVRQVSFETAMKSDKKVILEMEMHACTDSPRPLETIKEKFFDDLFQDRDILERMRNGTFFIFLYYGYEADDFTIKLFQRDKFKCHYDMFETVLSEYNLPSNSLIILSSNLNGYSDTKKYHFKNTPVNVIYENATEFQPFKHIPRGGFQDYTFDEYIHNIKNADKKLLRISRTSHPYRDCMLYFLTQNNYIDDSLIDHFYFEGDYLNEFYSQKKHIDGKGIKDEDIIRKIKEQTPYIASDYEKKFGVGAYPGAHPPNEAIPFDVYKKTIFSWVSTSASDQRTKVFINMSTFNPVLHFHPLVWFGEPNNNKRFKESGYKTFDWLLDESYDEETDMFKKWKKVTKEIHKIMNIPKDTLINLIIDNRDTLEHNQNLLYKCNSIEKILRKFHSIMGL